MIAVVTIKAKDLKPFKGEDGEEIPYAWYRAEREGDGVEIRIGSTNLNHEIGQKIEMVLCKKEGFDKRGKPAFRYTEIVPKA